MSGSLDVKSVAVLLAAYNARPWIEEQIISIRAQVGVSVQIFISLDESSDDSDVYLAGLASQYNLVLLASCGRMGGAARNFFRLIRDVDFSRYDYVALADQDDLWKPLKLLGACASLESRNAAGYSSNILAFWPDGREKLIKKSQPQTEFDCFFESAGPGCTYVMRTPDLLAFKGFLIANYERVTDVALHDWFIYAWFRSSGRKWIIDSEPTMYYRQHELNEVGANDGLKAILRRLSLLRSGWYRREVTKISQLCSLSATIPYFILEGRSFGTLRRVFKTRRRLRDKFFLIVIVLLGLY